MNLPAVPTRATFAGDAMSEWEQADAALGRSIITAIRHASLSVLIIWAGRALEAASISFEEHA